MEELRLHAVNSSAKLQFSAKKKKNVKTTFHSRYESKKIATFATLLLTRTP